MPARWSGRANKRKSSSSGMAENAPHLVLHPRLRPIGMLALHSSRLHFAGRPVKAFGHPQPFLAGHGAKDFNLFRCGLFILQYGTNMRLRGYSRKQNAFYPSCPPCAGVETRSRDPFTAASGNPAMTTMVSPKPALTSTRTGMDLFTSCPSPDFPSGTRRRRLFRRRAGWWSHRGRGRSKAERAIEPVPDRLGR